MRVDLDHRGLEQLPREEFIWDLLQPAAHLTRDIAVAAAPVHKGERKDRARGTYKRSLYAKQARSETRVRTYRVVSYDPIANLVEWESRGGRQQGHHVLARAAREAGLTVYEVPKRSV